MPGGLLQLSAYGQSNIILNGNPQKTFFNAVYKSYTQFGLQRFRIDYTGERMLSLDSETEFEFKIPRYGDLLWDSYIVVNMPNIWSPLHYRNDIDGNWFPYEFRWTKELGLAMINEVTIHSGGAIFARYSGEFMSAMLQRDETSKLDLLNRMIGNIPEMNDPKKHNGGQYPNSVNNIEGMPDDAPPSDCNDETNPDVTGMEPSIRGRKLYIPLSAWFCNSPKTALPLVSLQYQEVFITIKFKPIRQLFTILDVQSKVLDDDKCPEPLQAFNQYKKVCNYYDNGTQLNSAKPFVFGWREFNEETRKAPNTADAIDQLWRFLQPPPSIYKLRESPNVYYTNKRNDWNADIHILSTYIFLDNEERNMIASKNHSTLIKTHYEWDFLNSTGSKSVNVPSRDMVTNYMWRFRRSDVNKRNEWHNYQNFPWENTIPKKSYRRNTLLSLRNITETSKDVLITSLIADSGDIDREDYGNLNSFNLHYADCLNSKYIKNIMINMGIILGDEYRENVLDEGVYSMVEKWSRTSGIAKDGLYCYNFCIDSNRLIYQPCGAQNTNKWKHVTFEFNTIQPPKDLCNEGEDIDYLCEDGNIIGLRKNQWNLNEYNFDLRVFEERYNMIEITSGRMGLMLAR